MTLAGAARRIAPALWGMALLSACGDRAEDREIRVDVREVAIDPRSHAPVVVLADAASGAELPIWIGPLEARAIASSLEGIEPPRPMTHDLVKAMLDRAEVGFERALIHALEDGTYYARIFLRAGGETLDIDSRPSDAIALALRFDRPVFVNRELLVAAAPAGGTAAEGGTLAVQGITVQALSADLAGHFGLGPGGGVLVTAVDPLVSGSLRTGDVILAVDGHRVAGVGEFARLVSAAREPPHFDVKRGDRRIRLTLEAPRG